MTKKVAEERVEYRGLHLLLEVMEDFNQEGLLVDVSSTVLDGGKEVIDDFLMTLAVPYDDLGLVKTRNQPAECPKCGTQKLRAGHIKDMGLDEAYRVVTCEHCGREWREIFKYAGSVTR